MKKSSYGNSQTVIEWSKVIKQFLTKKYFNTFLDLKLKREKKEKQRKKFNKKKRSKKRINQKRKTIIYIRIYIIYIYSIHNLKRKKREKKINKK